MTKPTVCFVHGDALDLFRGENGPRFGGCETQVYQLATLLAESDEFETRFIADRDVAGAHFPGITFDWSRPPIARGVPYVSRFINRARRRAPYKDLKDAILIQTVLSQRYTEPTWRIAREMGFKFVYRMSCDADIDGSLHPPEVAKRLVPVIQDADGVIAQSVEQQEKLRELLGVESTIIRSIVDLPNAGPAIGGSYVLWAGRGAPIKRPWIMIETARLLPDIQFVMLMPIEDKLFWRFVVQEATQIPNLTVVPGVSYFEMERYYREAAIFASTSAIEGVPSVFLQSAAAGTPIVSLEVDPDGMLEHEGLGYCARGDVDDFRRAISEYMSEPRLVQERGSAAFEYAKNRHSRDVVGPLFEEFLKAVSKSER